MIARHLSIAGAALAALSLAACATAPAGPTASVATSSPAPVARAATPAPAAVRPAPAVPVRDRIRHAVDMLGRGQRDLARAELMLALGDQPDSRVARTLLDQIDRDPRALLGERNYPYKVRPGETLSMLADRFLGDPLLFYALARYNGIDVPDTAETGRTLLIPGVPKKAAPPAQAAARKAPAAPSTDPGRASGLRRTALEAMSKGSIDQAVALLQQAQPLDPANGLIRSDLERALRIQQSVRSR